ISFRLDLNRLPDGMLMCQVRRKGNIKSDHQPNTDTTYIEAVKTTSKIMRLLVTWKIDYSLEFNVRVVLVEHDNELVLNEEKQSHLYDKINDITSEEYEFLFKHDIFPKTTLLIC